MAVGTVNTGYPNPPTLPCHYVIPDQIQESEQMLTPIAFCIIHHINPINISNIHHKTLKTHRNYK